ncbi:MAG TPA: hypothetical protein VMP10_02235 [Chloroflexota bacterium]|nr:hypothetical protein [Chloroflexota bacterium]
MMQFASAQVIKMITEKVMDNVSRQLTERQGSVTAKTLAPPEEIVAEMVATHVRRNLADLNARMESTAALAERTDARMTRLERQWNWVMVLRIGSIVLLALVIGFAIGVLARASGWV